MQSLEKTLATVPQQKKASLKSKVEDQSLPFLKSDLAVARLKFGSKTFLFILRFFEKIRSENIYSKIVNLYKSNFKEMASTKTEGLLRLEI